MKILTQQDQLLPTLGLDVSFKGTEGKVNFIYPGSEDQISFKNLLSLAKSLKFPTSLESILMVEN